MDPKFEKESTGNCVGLLDIRSQLLQVLLPAMATIQYKSNGRTRSNPVELYYVNIFNATNRLLGKTGRIKTLLPP